MTEKSRKTVIKQVVTYIERHLDEPMDLKRVARAAGYSAFHLNRMFAAETGCTIHRYICARRLTAAAEKLVKTKLPIVQISGEAGYASQQAFSAAFKKLYLCPPQAYRDRGIFVPGQSKAMPDNGREEMAA